MKKITLSLITALIVSVFGLQAQSWTAGTNLLYSNPATTKVGIGTTNPTELLHINGGALKIGNSTSADDRALNMIKIGDGSYVQIGEWEADDMLSFKASKYNFTGGNVGIGIPNPVAKLDVNGQIKTTGILYSANDKFNYDSKQLDHYGLSWGMDSWSNEGLSLWQSAYGGMKFFAGGQPRISITRLGNVGIGTTEPQAKLEVNAEGNPENLEDNTDNGIMIKGTDHVLYMGVHTDSHVGYIQSVDYGTTTSPLLLNARGGNVGIGTYNPVYRLDVNGAIRAREVVVNLNDGADFVFEEDYNLKPLDEVHSFIKENKHLPEIPSAAEMVNGNGVSMGEFQVKLLQKIEELTLYSIQQNEKILELENKINNLTNGGK